MVRVLVQITEKSQHKNSRQTQKKYKVNNRRRKNKTVTGKYQKNTKKIQDNKFYNTNKYKVEIQQIQKKQDRYKKYTSWIRETSP